MVGFFIYILPLLLFFTAMGGSWPTIRTDEAQQIEMPQTPQPLRRDSVRIVFSGDVMQHMPQVSAALHDSTYNYDSCFEAISPLWREADWTVVNLETTLTDDGKYSGYPMFASPQSLARALRDAGVDLMALANNHCLDRGRRGVVTTLHTIDSLGIARVGVYTDSLESERGTMLVADNFRVAVLNYTYGTNGIRVPSGVVVNMIDTLLIERHIEAARKDSASHVIAFFHWGEEYQRSANGRQRELAAWCRSRGVDLVIGSHPHVVQQVDTAQRVVYSLGNFVSNQRKRYQDGGISVVVTLFGDGRQANIEVVPHWVYTPFEGGVRRYYVLPGGVESVKDSAYRLSIDDNSKVVGNVNLIR